MREKPLHSRVADLGMKYAIRIFANLSINSVFSTPIKLYERREYHWKNCKAALFSGDGEGKKTKKTTN
jgi:hypothetical protein